MPVSFAKAPPVANLQPEDVPIRVAAGSFRDPSGVVYRRSGVLYRQVNACYREHFDHLTDSGLLERLVAGGLLIPHGEADIARARDAGAYKVLQPELIPFVSHPYEWCFGQLRQAALITLEAQELALAHGMTLKDASAFNVQFRGGRGVLIDTLSFEKYREGQPWDAYRQFCQHFLAPLALMSFVDSSFARLSALHIDGVPLPLAARLLPWRTRLNFPWLSHVHLHAAAQLRVGRGEPRKQTGRMSLNGLRGLVDSLKSTIDGMRWKSATTVWSDYYATHRYAAETFAAKAAVVGEFIGRTRPAAVWDLGANEGVFSRIASDRGIPTVAFDVDHDAVQNCFAAIQEGPGNLLPLVMDLTNPSPGLGWAHEERNSLVGRGPADLVLALALVHHLAIGNNVPLPQVAAFLASVGRHVVAEFVPKSDSQVVRMLQSRRDVFPSYTCEHFEQACAERFHVRERRPLPGSERVVFLLERRSGTES